MSGASAFDIQGEDALTSTASSGIFGGVFARTGAFAVGPDASASDGNDPGSQGLVSGGGGLNQTLVLLALIGGGVWIVSRLIRR